MKKAKKRPGCFRGILGRDLMLLLKGMPMALLLAAVLGVLAVLAAWGTRHGADTGYTPAPLAIVDEDGSFTSTLTISVLTHQDFTAPLEIVKTSRQKAEAGLAEGRFCGVLYLPKDYAGDILVGERTGAELVLSDSVPLHADVLSLLCEFGQELLSTGQYGIFAGEELVWEIAPECHSAYLKNANARFLGSVLEGTGTVREPVSYGMTGVSAENWYVLMYAMCFFQLLCLGCTFFTRDRKSGILRRLYSAGVRDWMFLGSKLLILFLFYWVLAAGALLWAKLPVTLPGLLSLGAGLLTSAAVGLALIWCLPREQAPAAVTAVTAGGLLTGGGIIPRMELPRVVTQLGDMLPLGASARAAGALLGGGTDGVSGAVCLAWVTAAWLAMLSSMKRLRKGAEL